MKVNSFFLSGAVLLNTALPISAALPDTPAITACASQFTSIHHIQGTADSSPLVGQQLTTRGVVTAVVYPNSKAAGIVLRGAERGDTAASGSLFIADKAAAATYRPGQPLQITGTVAEVNQLTSLIQLTDIRLCGEATKVQPVTLQLPLTKQQSWEQLEGELLQFSQPLTVNDTYSLGRYGEITLADKRLMTATEVMLPGKDAIALTTAQQERHMLVLDDGLYQQLRCRVHASLHHLPRRAGHGRSGFPPRGIGWLHRLERPVAAFACAPVPLAGAVGGGNVAVCHHGVRLRASGHAHACAQEPDQ